MNNIKFTIAIPAFKMKYLSDCITSILNQTYKDFELIIVNDCSPEPLDLIVSKFDDYRISYHKNDFNLGAINVVDNWNRCLEKASGDFFVLMGDDDFLEPDYLEVFSNLIKDFPDLDVYHCRTKVIDENSLPLYLTPSLPVFESVYDFIWHRINGHRIQFISDFVYRTTVLKKNGGFFKLPLAWASDDISAYIACGKKGIAHTNKPVFCYRTNPYNISSTGNGHSKIEAIKLEEEWFASFLKVSPKNDQDLIIYRNISKDLKKYLQKRKIYTVASSFEKELPKNFFGYFRNRRQFKLSLAELFFAVFEKYRRNEVKTKY